MDFIFDPSLVLYAPLHQLDGASFMSRDAYGHLCTVTGATWGLQGRAFDDLDDIISIGNLSADVYTAIFWFKPAAELNSSSLLDGFVSFNTDDSIEFGSLTGSLEGEVITIGHQQAGTDRYTTIPNITVSAAWHHLALVWNGSYYDMHLDSVAQSVITNIAGHVQLMTASDFRLGKGEQASNYYNGTIGEVWIYNRVLNPIEIQRIYMATKERYR